jgi:hypothetical protein
MLVACARLKAVKDNFSANPSLQLKSEVLPAHGLTHVRYWHVANM